LSGRTKVVVAVFVSGLLRALKVLEFDFLELQAVDQWLTDKLLQLSNC